MSRDRIEAQDPLTYVVERKSIFFQPRSRSSPVAPEGGIPWIQLDSFGVKVDGHCEVMTWTPHRQAAMADRTGERTCERFVGLCFQLCGLCPVLIGHVSQTQCLQLRRGQRC